MGLISDFLGGGGNENAVTQTKPWDAQSPYIKNVFQEAQRQYLDFNPTYYPGQTVAPFSQSELAAQNYLQNYASGIQPFINQAQDFSGYLMGEGLNPDSNPYLSKYADAAARPITQNFLESVMPRIRADYRRGQPFGGSKESQAVGMAAGRAADAIGDITSRLYGNAYGQNLQAAINSMQLMPNIMQAGAYPAQLMSGVGESQRAMEQARIGDAQQRWNFYQQQPYNKLDRYANLVGGQMYGGKAMEPTATSNVGNVIGGGLLGGAVLGPAIQDAAFGAIGAGTGASSPLWALSGPWGMGAGILAGGLLGSAL